MGFKNLYKALKGLIRLSRALFDSFFWLARAFIRLLRALAKK